MRTHALSALLLLATAGAALAADRITISATKKTVDELKGSEQDLPRGKSRSVEKQVIYRFDVQRAMALNYTALSVEWIVLVEGSGGNIFPGTMGRRNVEIPLGRGASVETDPVKLVGREWRGGPSPGTVEDTIAGYGVRVLSPDGVLLAEKYDPASARSRIDWKLLDTRSKKEMQFLQRRMPPGAVPGSQAPADFQPPE